MNIVGDMAHWRQTGEGHPLLIECWFSLRVLWNGCSIWIAFRHVDPLDYDERQAIRWPEIEPKGSVVEAYTAVPAGLSG
jgi:hypothetical protein